jgi:hypothetical protein
MLLGERTGAGACAHQGGPDLKASVSGGQTKKRKASVSIDTAFGAWQNHTNGFGLKLLQKFGFKGRLGKAEDGVSRPIEVLLRPKGMGLGNMSEMVNLPANKEFGKGLKAQVTGEGNCDISDAAAAVVLRRQGWRWAACGDFMELGGDALLLTMAGSGDEYDLATGGDPMTEGRHYWEVELMECQNDCAMHLGAVRPGLKHSAQGHSDTDDAYFIYGGNSSLFGNGRLGEEEQGRLAKGDRVGCLLDLDAGWLRFYLNGTRCGPGFVEGVTGPLVRAVELFDKGDAVRALPGAAAPRTGEELLCPT